MPEIKLNLRPNLLRLFRYLSAIILNYLNQFRKRSNKLTEVYDKSNINKENCKKDVREYKDLKKKVELNMITLVESFCIVYDFCKYFEEGIKKYNHIHKYEKRCSAYLACNTACFCVSNLGYV
ncbi:replicative DNA helicase [Orientia tsutsugamushi]|nr:hypothetical protein OTSTA763_1510 [Orientia tsutsugamushi str. TA763]SPP23688.1 replicative DNA helicase [Orientia tsutsugamushi]